MRLCTDHHEVILCFSETFPQIITNRFVGLSSKKELENLWEQLTSRLNSLGYGNLSAREYKRRITDWKSKVKGKAADINASLHRTGGGEKSAVTLTQHEQRLLALMGNKGYEGDNVKEMGMETSTVYIPTINESSVHYTGPSTSKMCFQPQEQSNTAFVDPADEVIVPETSIEIMEDNNLQVKDISSKNDHDYVSNSEKTLHTEQTRKRKRLSTNRRRCIRNLAETVQHMNNETLTVLKEINTNIKTVGDELKKINDTLNSA